MAEPTKVFTNKPMFFIGAEVERTKFFGQKTLFARGDVSLEELIPTLEKHSVNHVYLGASKTHKHFLYNRGAKAIVWFLIERGYCVTVEVEPSTIDVLVETIGPNLATHSSMCLNVPFHAPDWLIKNICVKCEPYNPFSDGEGVFCATFDVRNFTPWSAYSEDEEV